MEAPRNESREPEARKTTAVGTSPLPPKPKRKYTVSEKSRKASRENLEKANLAPKWLKYRLTDRRKAACYKALEKAVERLRQFDSPHYGLGFKRGTYCASILRSPALAGEKKEDYEEHLDLFQEGFGPLDDQQRKFVQATAEAVWRRLRVHRGRARWEKLAVATVLAEVIGEQAEKASGQPLSSDRAVLLGLQIVSLLLDTKPQREARRLNLRIERLLRGMMEVDEAMGFIFAAKPRSEEEEYRKRTAESLGNPLRTAAQIVEALREKQGEKIKEPEGWQGGGEVSEENRTPGCLGADERAKQGGMMRDLQRGTVAGVNLEQLEGPDGKVVWMKLWLQAFGVADASDSNGEASYEYQVSRFEVLALAEMVWERIEMFRQHGEKEAADVREVMQTAVLAKRAAAEEIDDCKPFATAAPEPCLDSAKTEPTGDPEHVFQASIDNRQSSVSSSIRDAAVMVLASLSVIKSGRAQLEALRDLNRGYYELLVKLYGPRVEFESFLRESKQSAMDMGSAIIRALLGSHIRAKGGKVEDEIEWRGGFGGRAPRGGP